MNNLKGNLLYVAAVLLAFTWAIGYYGQQATGAIHLLLLAAVVLAYISIWDIEKPRRKKKRDNEQRLA